MGAEEGEEERGEAKAAMCGRGMYHCIHVCRQYLRNVYMDTHEALLCMHVGAALQYVYMETHILHDQHLTPRLLANAHANDQLRLQVTTLKSQ